MAGLEVEELAPAAPPFSNVVVAEILEVAAKHPNADRLSLCKVDAGSRRRSHIVCGAPNVRAGMKRALRAGRRGLPPGDDGKPFEIKRSANCAASNRRACCARRANWALSDDHGGILPLAGRRADRPHVRDCFELDDTLFTIKLTPNSADCLWLLGVAREVAAITGRR